jgi:hypothetical protein
MSLVSAAQEPDQSPAQSPGQGRALARLDELKRALQRQLNRRPTTFERAAMDRAALMTLRAEIAARDPDATSADVVRLDNAARRARNDFCALARIGERKPKRRSMAELEAEVRAHG